MKTLSLPNSFNSVLRGQFWALLLICCSAKVLHATVPAPGGGPSSATLDTWSFENSITWASDLGYAPLSYTNLAASSIGDGNAVVVDSASLAWLRYNATETSGTNELKVDRGSLLLWFAPNWASTTQGGTGPGVWGRLIDVGASSANPT